MIDGQSSPVHRAAATAYRQAGYTIEETPSFEGADAAALWVARDDQTIAVIATSFHGIRKPGVLLAQVDHLSQHVQLHILTGSQAAASRVQTLLQNPVRMRTDCGVECYSHPAYFSFDDTRLAVSDPHVWIATSSDQSPPDGTVLSVPVELATPFGYETDGVNPAASTINKRPEYESTVTELKSTETPPETSHLVRTPVITQRAGSNYGVVIAVLSDGTLTAHNAAQSSEQTAHPPENRPQQTLGSNTWETPAPPALGVTQLHLVAQSRWEDR